MRYLACASLMAGLFVITGCSESDSAPAAVAVASNSVCPIMGHDVTDDGGRVEFDGKTVGFCCSGCIEKWNALSAEDKAEKLKNPPSEEGDHGVHDHDEHENHEAHGDHDHGDEGESA